MASLAQRRVMQVVAQSNNSGPALQRGGGLQVMAPTREPNIRTVSARDPNFGILGTLGTAVGTALGGPVGGAIGGALGSAIEGGTSSQPGQRTQVGAGGGAPSNLIGTNGTCPRGTRRIPGIGCVDLVPGGATQGQGIIVEEITAPAASAGAGIFGIPGAVTPGVVATQRLRCPRGMVLGDDNMCYHKSVIPKKFRKWKPAAKPPVSAADAKAIRRADAAKNRVKRLATKSGFTCKKR